MPIMAWRAKPSCIGSVTATIWYDARVDYALTRAHCGFGQAADGPPIPA